MARSRVLKTGSSKTGSRKAGSTKSAASDSKDEAAQAVAAAPSDRPAGRGRGKRGRKVAKKRVRGRTSQPAGRAAGRSRGKPAKKVAAAVAQKTAGRRSAAKGRGGSTTLRNASIEQLQQEIARRESQLAVLETERIRLADALASLDETLADLGSNHLLGRSNHRGVSASSRRGRRSGNGMSLVEAMQRVLPNAVMSVAEIGDAVRAIGYETASRNFRTVITNALGKHTHLFKKVSRGRYTAH